MKPAAAPHSQAAEAEAETEKKTPITADISDNERIFKDYLGSSADLDFRHVTLRETGNAAVVCFLESVVDKLIIDQFVVGELLQGVAGLPFLQLPEIRDIHISTHSLKTAPTFEEAAKELLTGKTIIFIEGLVQALVASTDGGQRRAVSEAVAEAVVRGPREAFNESILTNLGLIRRRILSPKLRVERMYIGKVSNTSIAVLYIEGIAKSEIVEEVRSRLKKIDIDGILESQYIEEFIEDPVYSPFPTVFNTERPDRVAAALLEGRVGILTDGTPIALVVPATIGLFLFSNEDYYQRFDFSSLLRILRMVTFLLSFLLPSFYVALLTFHQEMIPTSLLIALTGQREGVPFGIATEVLLMELVFEILREAGIRLPKTVGAAVSIVGGLVLGQAAVEASLIGPGTVIAVSATAIASFTTPSYGFAIAARMFRFVMLFLTAFIGAYGFFFGLIFVVIHLNKLRSFGVPYMSPIAPFHKKSWKDLFIRMPWWEMRQRPDEVAANQTRFEESQKWNKSRGGKS